MSNYIKLINNLEILKLEKIKQNLDKYIELINKKEKEYLQPLPNSKIIEQYLIDTMHVKISNESLFYYKGKKYSVPSKFINSTLDIQEDNNKLYVYYNKELITIHDISEKNINYKEEHYIEALSNILKNKTQSQIEALAKENLENLNKLCEVKGNE